MIKARTFDQVSAERAEAEPTPETNACIAAIRGQSLEGLCRKLERERDNLKHRIAALEADRLKNCAYELQLEVELDDVKSELSRVRVEWAKEREKCSKMRAAIRALLEQYDCKNEVMPAYYQALDALGETKWRDALEAAK